ncbi:hypothetical protein K438DRAFT_1961526 [Mycena galopus ATCC 62051]|nr:hypothetical protein K438DRAFT_1961526 [Mycena galopus ATCC 62051]
MSNDPEGAIAVPQRGLEAPQTFVQADTLVRLVSSHFAWVVAFTVTSLLPLFKVRDF